jgi:hypothetical protein
MYDDTNTTNTAMDQVAEDINNQPQGFGLGINPSSATPPPAPPATTAPVTDQNQSTPPSFSPVQHPVQVNDKPDDPQAEASSPLDEIKHDALEQLSPLVDKLDQTPEERYKTLMMMIQASDDQSLIKSAYDAAQKISDEKLRAEALLGVVNEINYFTNKK